MRQRLSQKLEVGGSRLEDERAQPRSGCPEQASPAPGIFVDSRRESKNRIGMREPPPHPRVFWEKSPQSIENKGREVGKEGLLGRGAGETKLWRVFTSDDRTDCRSCQSIKWVLVFRDWAQKAEHAQGHGNKRKSKAAPFSAQTATCRLAG